jgi:hypothetical protein
MKALLAYSVTRMVTTKKYAKQMPSHIIFFFDRYKYFLSK